MTPYTYEEPFAGGTAESTANQAPNCASPSSRVLAASINDALVGWLVEDKDVWAFEYAPTWQAHPQGFDLSPALPRATQLHRDGSTSRPVQWYFDNLLPEEALRTVLAKEAKLDEFDAFGMLKYFGAESAGSLVLEPPGSAPAQKGLKPLPLLEVFERIQNLPRAPMTQKAPKRMSLAGAQHKMVVVLKGKELFEPLPGTPSTYILKPPSISEHYPASVMNEYFTMRLAKAVGINVPKVLRMYTPAPIYLVERFDRARPPGSQEVSRLHIIDTCQLLNLSRQAKYQRAQLKTLLAAVQACRSLTKTRLQLFRWTVFNVLIGNSDNHLKNISFNVGPDGIELAPAYDLLCTAVYETTAFADQNATWPKVQLAVSLQSVNFFEDVTRDTLVQAGLALGLQENTVQRELQAMARKLPVVADNLIAEIDAKFDEAIQVCPDPVAARPLRGGEMRLLRSIRHIILQDMLKRTNLP